MPETTTTTTDPAPAPSPPPRRKIWIMTRAGGGRLHWKHAQAKMAFAARIADMGLCDVSTCDFGAAGIDRSINAMIDMGLADEQVSDFLSWDADTIPRPVDLALMLLSPFEVVGAPYPLGTIDWALVVDAVQAGADAEILPWLSSGVVCNFTQAQLLAPIRNVEGLPPWATFIECNSLGLGCTMFRRSAFERFRDAYASEIAFTHYETPSAPPERRHAFFTHGRDPLKNSPEGTYYTEDSGWFARWRAIGGKVHAFTSARMLHVKSFEFRACLDLHVRLAEKRVADGLPPARVVTQGERAEELAS